MLADKYGVAADVWSVTSYSQLAREAYATERWNVLHPLEKKRVPYVAQCLAGAPGVVVAASDYLKLLPDSIARWIGRPVASLGTDGFGRSEDRKSLRDFFEVDARFVTLSTLSALAREGTIEPKVVAQAIKDLDISPDKANPATS
jgi:pyruvate dehydrogenase E1 component